MILEYVRLGDVVSRVTRSETVISTKKFPMLGVRSFGRGAFDAGELAGVNTSYSKLNMVMENDVVYPKLMAWEGAFAIVDDSLSGRFVSPEFCTFEIDERVLHQAYLGQLMQADSFLLSVRSAAIGTNVRRRRLQPTAFEDIRIPLPPLDEQRRISATLKSVTSMSDRVASSGLNASSIQRSLVGAKLGNWGDRFGQFVDLGDVALVQRGTTLRQSIESSEVAFGQGCVRWGFDWSNVKPINPSWAATVPIEKRSRSGSILLNSTGEGTIGRAAKVTEEAAGYVLDSKVLQISPGDESLKMDFLYAWIWSSFGQEALNRLKGATTTKQTELGLARIKKLKVPQVTSTLQNEFIASVNLSSGMGSKFSSLTQRRIGLSEALPKAVRNEIFSKLVR